MGLLPLLAVALAAGIAVRHPLPAALLLLPALLSPRLARVRFLILAFLLGAVLPTTHPTTALTAALPDGAPLVRVEGTVRTGPDLPTFGLCRFDLGVDRVGNRKVTGRVRVYAPPTSSLPAPGDRIQATGRLLRPGEAMNPGQTGSRRALADRGISHLLLLRTGRSIRILHRPKVPSPARVVYRARVAADRALLNLRPRETGDLLACLLLGRRDRVPPDVTDAFRRSGTAHFLAISGLHVALLSGLLWLLLRPLPLGRAPSAVLVAAFALFYAAMTGLRPPALRAALLAGLFAAGVVLRRPPRILPLLATAAFAILAAEPADLGRVGFQLSFVAVLAIVLLAPRFEAGLFPRYELLQKFSVPRSRPWPIRFANRYVVKAVPVSLAAWLGTAPIVLTRFKTISTLVVPANLLVCPFIALLIPAGLIAMATGFALPATLLVIGLTALVKALATVPGVCFTLPSPPLPAVIAFYVVLGLATRRLTLGRRAAGLLLLALAALSVSGLLLHAPPARPRVTVLSVGHGLMVVVETSDGGVLVYDAGSDRRAIFHRVIRPFLLDRGIVRIDLLVIPQAGSDHGNTVPALTRDLFVKRVIAPGEVHAGESLPLRGAEVTVLGPSPHARLREDDAATILRIRLPGFSVLLTGDIREAGIAALLSSHSSLRADLLVLPRHGAVVPGARRLLAAVRPRVLVASDDPSDRIDSTWKGAIETSKRGAVTVRPGPKVTTFR